MQWKNKQKEYERRGRIFKKKKLFIKNNCGLRKRSQKRNCIQFEEGLSTNKA